LGRAWCWRLTVLLICMLMITAPLKS